MVKLFLVIVISILVFSGCMSTSSADLEYRMRLLERRMNWIESDFDNVIDQCTVDDVEEESN